MIFAADESQVSGDPFAHARQAWDGLDLAAGHLVARRRGGLGRREFDPKKLSAET